MDPERDARGAAAAIVDDAPTLLRRTCEEPHECVESTRLAGGQEVLMESQEKMDADRLLLPRTCEMTDDVDDSDEDYMDSEEEQELMGCRLPKVCVCVIHIHMYVYVFMSIHLQMCAEGAYVCVLCVCVYVHVHVHVHVCVVCVCVCVYISTYIYYTHVFIGGGEAGAAGAPVETRRARPPALGGCQRLDL